MRPHSTTGLLVLPYFLVRFPYDITQEGLLLDFRPHNLAQFYLYQMEKDHDDLV